MKWKKQGLIYAPSGGQSWARTHAMLPTPLWSGGGTIRMYFTCLDKENYGRLGYADLDVSDPKRVLSVATHPLLDLGELGTFDDCGVVPSCAISKGDEIYLYYIGFQRAQRVPYMLFTGLARGTPDGDKFQRHARTPVLDRTPAEPFSRGAPFVLAERDGFRAWYWSCTHWTQEATGAHYNNVIRHARSDDGIHWTADAEPCLVPAGQDEFALGRPCVVRDGPLYRMWYSIRFLSRGYRIGYAESADGLRWQRLDDQAGIDVSSEGWDSEMVCYPMVIDFGGARHMFYNGNRHGATGFGWAVLEN